MTLKWCRWIKLKTCHPWTEENLKRLISSRLSTLKESSNRTWTSTPSNFHWDKCFLRSLLKMKLTSNLRRRKNVCLKLKILLSRSSSRHSALQEILLRSLLTYSSKITPRTCFLFHQRFKMWSIRIRHRFSRWRYSSCTSATRGTRSTRCHSCSLVCKLRSPFKAQSKHQTLCSQVVNLSPTSPI